MTPLSASWRTSRRSAQPSVLGFHIRRFHCSFHSWLHSFIPNQVTSWQATAYARFLTPYTSDNTQMSLLSKYRFLNSFLIVPQLYSFALSCILSNFDVFTIFLTFYYSHLLSLSFPYCCSLLWCTWPICFTLFLIFFFILCILYKYHVPNQK